MCRCLFYLPPGDLTKEAFPRFPRCHNSIIESLTQLFYNERDIRSLITQFSKSHFRGILMELLNNSSEQNTNYLEFKPKERS